jgi:hypothetical protein
MNNISLDTDTPNVSRLAQVSWGAIFAGVIMALTVQSLFNLLGLGLGLTVFTLDADVLKTLAVNSIIWLIVTSLASMFIGSWVAARCSNVFQNMDGALHGLVTWGVATLLTFILLTTTLGTVVAGTLGMVGQGISLVGKGTKALGEGAASIGKGAINIAPQLAETAQNLVPDLSPAVEQITQQAEEAIHQVKSASVNTEKNVKEQNGLSKEEMRKKLQEVLKNLFTASNENDVASVRQKAIDFLVQNQNISQSQAEQMVNDWLAKYQQLKDQINQKAEQAKQATIEATEKATNALGRIAFITVLVSLVGAVASIFGGMLGLRNKR